MKRIFILIFIIFIPIKVFAHTLLLNVYNNEDNTLSIEGVFSTGEAAIGAEVRLESLINDKVLYKKRLPIENELIIKIPDEPYKIILDGGPSHKIEKEGIPPINGFSKKIKEIRKVKKTKNIDYFNEVLIKSIGTIIYILLLILTIYFSRKNTKKLIEELKI